MPNQRAVPTLRRRRLGNELRRRRTAAGLESRAAAEAMGWAESKYSRVENAKGRVTPQEVESLLKFFGVEDPQVVAALTNLARDAGKRGWWRPYGDVLADSYRDFLDLEADAELEQVTAPGLIPGLLQTGGYAREIIAATGLTLTQDEVHALAELRRARQAILTTRPGGQAPLRLWAVIHEAALHMTSVEQPHMMREQLRHLLDMTDLPNVTIQVLDLKGTANPGLVGLIEVVHFPAPWPTVVNLENLQGSHFVEGTEDVKVFEDAFARVVAAALSVDDSRLKIRNIMNGMNT
ncbi:helix-turn-helix domain-containing protein [Streptomyces sp. NPDC001255]|uniref:helix-turn-helix domain-containing protein n=1 Tax=Streptomyces sp. NPDC001255 TaxID=3364550 RepID=UPI00367C9AAC